MDVDKKHIHVYSYFMNAFLEAKEKGASYAKIAEYVGMDRSAIYLILHEKRGTSLQIALKIGEFLELPEKASIEAWRDMMYRKIDKEIEEYRQNKKR
jgi:DNA-binding XRE family transcriptional regulator